MACSFKRATEAIGRGVRRQARLNRMHRRGIDTGLAPPPFRSTGVGYLEMWGWKGIATVTKERGVVTHVKCEELI